jgi:hypothetical protein
VLLRHWVEGGGGCQWWGSEGFGDADGKFLSGKEAVGGSLRSCVVKIVTGA